MQIAMDVLIIGIIQLLLLIAGIYGIIFLRMQYGMGIAGGDVLLLVGQVFNLTMLLQCIIGCGMNGRLLFLAEAAFMVMVVLRFLWLFHKGRACRQELRQPQSIRETIDSLPVGICFSTPGGKPVLTNRKMNQLVYGLTGHTIINVQGTWEELRQFRLADGCSRLNEPWIGQESADETAGECLYFSLSDDSIWRFHKEELSNQIPHTIQLTAVDISDLCTYSKELYENNQRLVKQYTRRQNLLKNIVEINQEKEILSAKIRIHGNLGRSILTTKHHLQNNTLAENISQVAETWNNTLRGLEDFTRVNWDTDVSPEVELQKVAEMIGCRIHFQGDRPRSRKAMRLFYAAVREALTNAVMHADADVLHVAIRPTEGGYHVEISDNGRARVTSIKEGSGLGNLRRKLQQENATLEVQCRESVTLIMELPAERDRGFVQKGESQW